MTEVKLGAATVQRIEESYEPNFDAKMFFPDWQPGVVQQHRDWARARPPAAVPAVCPAPAGAACACPVALPRQAYGPLVADPARRPSSQANVTMGGTYWTGLGSPWRGTARRVRSIAARGVLQPVSAVRRADERALSRPATGSAASSLGTCRVVLSRRLLNIAPFR